MQIAIIGTGYVGLVTGTCLADFGLSVTCVDQDETKISLLNSSGIPIYITQSCHPFIEKNISVGQLTFTTDLEKAVKESKVIIYYQFAEAMYIIYLKILFIKNLSHLI